MEKLQQCAGGTSPARLRDGGHFGMAKLEQAEPEHAPELLWRMSHGSAASCSFKMKLDLSTA